MNHLNSSFQYQLSSIYRGPHIFNMALTPEEEAAAAAEKAKADEEAAAAEAAKAEEEKKAEEEAKAAADAAALLQEDPLLTPNPFEEGSSQHDAFENQRAKFKAKLEKETSAAAEAASGGLSKKLDEVLTVLAPLVKPKVEPAKVAPKPVLPDGSKATAEDVEIVNDALRAMGIDPAQIVQERRRQQVDAALAQLKQEYPTIQFDDLELVTYANEQGISAMGGTPHDILEMALIRKNRATIAAGGPVKTTPSTTPPAKKDPVKVLNNGTKKDQPVQGDKPKTFAEYKAMIFKKHSGK